MISILEYLGNSMEKKQVWLIGKEESGSARCITSMV
jgi:hypothetical protein